MSEIFTIGHSRHDLVTFLGLLRAHAIAELADVRRKPWSGRNPQFNRERLAEALAAAGIKYRHFEDLGGLREPAAGPAAADNAAWRDGVLRAYADHALTPVFGAAFAALCDDARRQRTAVMCAEADWRNCHRQVIADYLLAGGLRVRHIAPDGALADATLNPNARVDGPAAVRYPVIARQRAFDF